MDAPAKYGPASPALPSRDHALIDLRRQIADCLGVLKGAASLAEALTETGDPRCLSVLGLLRQAVATAGGAHLVQSVLWQEALQRIHGE